MTYLMDNSMNWPHTSLYTGTAKTSITLTYQYFSHSGSVNVSWTIIDGHTDSVYLRMRERNLCNHRDYHNIGFNGARTVDGAQLTERYLSLTSPRTFKLDITHIRTWRFSCCLTAWNVVRSRTSQRLYSSPTLEMMYANSKQDIRISWSYTKSREPRQELLA